MRVRFRFRPIPFIATVLLVTLGIALGNWQQDRAATKAALQARLDARAAEPPLALDPAAAARPLPEYRRVTLRGRFVPGWAIALENRPWHGRSGFHLLMPFKIADSRRHVLVLRGWLPRDPANYGKLPAFATPGGIVTIEGRVLASAGRVMQLGEPAPLEPGAIVQNVDVSGFAAASGLALAPFFVQQTDAALPGEGLVRDWQAPDAGIDKHRGYAFQWYGLALAAFLFYVSTGIRRGTNHDD